MMLKIDHRRKDMQMSAKFSFSEKATKICAIFRMVLTLNKYLNVKAMRKIAQSFVAFSEKLNFNTYTKNISWNTYVITHTYLRQSAFTQCSVSDRFRFRFVNEYQVRNEVKFFMKSHLKFYRTLIFRDT